jgi:hypothetical protein
MTPHPSAFGIFPLQRRGKNQLTKMSALNWIPVIYMENETAIP